MRQCGENILFYLKPVGCWRIIMVTGAHDSMITIKNGGQCHIWRYTLAPLGPFGIIIIIRIAL